jgi:hypothetical protein
MRPGSWAHADLAREAACCSTAHLALVARLDDLLATTSTCAAPSGPLFRGFPQRRARRGDQGAIPVSGWQGRPSRQWSVARAGRVRPARWPRWASPGRRAPSQPSCCGDTRALRALRFYFFLSHFDDTVLTGVAIRGQNGLLRYRDIAISPLLKALLGVARAPPPRPLPCRTLSHPNSADMGRTAVEMLERSARGSACATARGCVCSNRRACATWEPAREACHLPRCLHAAPPPAWLARTAPAFQPVPWWHPGLRVGTSQRCAGVRPRPPDALALLAGSLPPPPHAPLHPRSSPA